MNGNKYILLHHFIQNTAHSLTQNIVTTVGVKSLTVLITANKMCLEHHKVLMSKICPNMCCAFGLWADGSH